MNEDEVVPIGTRPRPVSRGSQFLNYGFWLLYSLLSIRLLLALMDARGTPFVRFIAAITDPFYAPFRGIVDSPDVTGTGMVLVVPILVALVVYLFLHLAIHKLMQIMAYRQTVV